MLVKHTYLLLFCLFTIIACQKEIPNAVFSKISKSQTGIDFRNMLKEDENFNIFKYQYFNNGGGVAVGDFNNDGLQDIVFTGNMVKNRLYINQGNFEFEDFTQQSGIAEKEGWCTGVTTADVNGDGWLDIHICRAGYPFEKLRTNLLFINNGDLTFTEKAEEYGLADAAFSTHSAFFDYDKDGDLDLFLLNHSTVEYSRGSLEVLEIRKKKNPDFTNKLYRNDDGHFVNVTEAAGVTSNVLTFSLGISISDINQDSWPDILIGNDFNEPDYLFINQKNGTFKEAFGDYFDHTSMFSMGSDVADFNNDGWLDLVSLDMMPEGNYLQKMHSGADNYDKLELLETNGFFKQSSRNMLQLNNGDGSFSEIGQMAGVEKTDWSWAPLFFDFDNDGHKDLFIANGYPKDHTDMDFLNFTANEVVKINEGKDHVDFDGYMEQMPAILVPNYFYKNDGGLHFENKAKEWGIDEPMISQSAAYADLDNDGDLDLVLNNTGDYAAIYQNNTERILKSNYLKVKLIGTSKNPSGIGAKIHCYADGKVFFQEQFPVRGFQSSVADILNFGLGKIEKIDSVVVVWPTDEKQSIKGIAVNQQLTINHKNAKEETLSKNKTPHTFFEEKTIVEAAHQENKFTDFKIQSLLPYFFSKEGPALAVADVNRDGKADFFMGNAKGNPSQLWLQNQDKTFQSATVFTEDAMKENTDATFFDANGDGFLDLYVASGSYEFPQNAPELADCLYLNDGKDDFVKTTSNLPKSLINSTCVKPADVDKDGDIDLFIGGGYIYGKYPESYESYLLINDGKGVFTKENLSISTGGSINDAHWADLNGDGFPELMIAGEWMSVQVFGNKNGTLANETKKHFINVEKGFWNALHASDLDNDGDLDLLVGNIGLNSQLTATVQEPLELYYDDFDENGSIDPLLCYFVQGHSYPFISRDDLLGQLPYLKKKFLFFKDYAKAQIQDILTPAQLEAAKKLEVNTLSTVYFENKNGQFMKKELPIEAQFAPIHAFESIDVNGDGHLDLLLAGNNLNNRAKLGHLEGNHGLVLTGNGKGDFQTMPAAETGLRLQGMVRAIEKIRVGEADCALFGVNNEDIKMYHLRKK